MVWGVIRERVGKGFGERHPVWVDGEGGGRQEPGVRDRERSERGRQKTKGMSGCVYECRSGDNGTVVGWCTADVNGGFYQVVLDGRRWFDGASYATSINGTRHSHQHRGQS